MLSSNGEEKIDEFSKKNFTIPEKLKSGEEELIKIASALDYEASFPPIKVCDPVKKEGIKTYVTYTIKLSESEEAIYRRYSEFYFLREKLVQRWPGVYIPNVPPKKALGNLKSKTVEFRMKLLNKFCLKLYKFEHSLFNSDEMKIFFTAGDNFDVKKGLSSLPDQTYEELNIKYKKALDPNGIVKEMIDPNTLTTAKARINDFQVFLKKALANVKNFKEVVQTVMKKKENEIENYLCLLSVFNDYEKYTLLDYVENDDSQLVFFNPKNNDLYLKLLDLKQGIDNPYTSLYNWLKEEEVDIEAMIEAISSINALLEMQGKLSKKIANREANIKYLKAGGGFLGLLNIIGLKTSKSEIKKFESEKVMFEKSYAYLSNVITLTIYHMDCQIETFKTEKLATYYSNLKLFSQLNMTNSNKITDLWKAAKPNVNGKAIEFSK